MSEILLLTDTHIGCRNSHSIIEQHILKFHQHIIQYIKDNDIHVVFHLGDMFDDRKSINVKTLDLFKTEFFDKLREMQVQLFVLVGNHDTYMRSHNQINTLETLFKKEDYWNVHVINKPTPMHIENTKFLMVPWMHNNHFDEYLNTIKESTADILCAHLEMQGFIMHSGVVSVDGMSINSFEHFDKVLTGHYHAKSSRDNVHYLGTSYDTTWADVMEKKFFHTLDTSNGTITPIEYNDRLFVRLVYNDAIGVIDVPNDLRGKFVKLIVRGKTDVLGFETLLNKINEQEPFEVSVVDETLIIGESSFEADEKSIADISMVINTSVDGLQDTDSVDKDRLKMLMQELYHDAIRDLVSED